MSDVRNEKHKKDKKQNVKQFDLILQRKKKGEHGHNGKTERDQEMNQPFVLKEPDLDQQIGQKLFSILRRQVFLRLSFNMLQVFFQAIFHLIHLAIGMLLDSLSF